VKRCRENVIPSQVTGEADFEVKAAYETQNWLIESRRPFAVGQRQEVSVLQFIVSWTNAETNLWR
jgi:hypothetical protein